ncbi:MAG: hypothetical protein HC902_05890 [Calothrix sp. SM1_5_4]|nr:hypothetical protein [Calothrix sp. SM1_5_4]
MVGFSNSADELDTVLRAPEGATAQQAYGTGFTIPFSLPVGYSSGQRRVIASTGIQEIDLQTGTGKGSYWGLQQQLPVHGDSSRGQGRRPRDLQRDR